MVDDEPLMTELVQTYLEDEGYANFVVSNDPCAGDGAAAPRTAAACCCST